MAVLYHHDPEAAPAGSAGTSRFHLAHVVHAADATVKDLDITIGPPRKGHIVPEEHRALVALGLAKHAGKLIEDFQVEFEAIRSLV
jgi:hypothetical protein